MKSSLLTAIVTLLLFTSVPRNALCQIPGRSNSDLIMIADSLKNLHQEDSAIILYNNFLSNREKTRKGVDSLTVYGIHQLARCHFELNNFVVSDSLLSVELPLNKQLYGANSLEVARNLYFLGEVKLELSQFDLAEQLLRDSYQLQLQYLSENDLELVPCLQDLALTLLWKGLRDDAEVFLRKTLTIFDLHPSHKTLSRVRSLNFLASIMSSKSQVVECETMCLEVISLLKDSVTTPDDAIYLGQAYGILGSLYRNIGKISKAVQLFLEQLKLLDPEDYGHKFELADNYQKLALVYSELGSYEKALPYSQRSHSLHMELYDPDDPAVGIHLSKHSLILKKLGKYNEAEKYCKLSIEILKKSQLIEFLYHAYQYLGSIYSEQNRNIESEQYFSLASVGFKELHGDSSAQYASSLGFLASVLIKLDKLNEAELLYNEAAAIIGDLGESFRVYVPGIYRGLSAISFKKGLILQAITLLEKAHSIESEYIPNTHPGMTGDAFMLGTYHALLGNHAVGLKYYQSGVTSRLTFMRQVFTYASEEQQLRYIRENPMINSHILSYALHIQNDATLKAAYESILIGKGFVIDAMSINRSVTYCSKDSVIERISSRIATLGNKISNSIMAPQHKDSSSYELNKALIERDSLESILSLGCSKFIKPSELNDITIQDILRRLPDKTVVMDFIKYDHVNFNDIDSFKKDNIIPHYLVSHYDNTGNISMSDLGESRIIDSLVLLSRHLISDVSDNVYSPLGKHFEDNLFTVTNRLYNIVFKPIIDNYNNIDQIVISSDGVLNLLPFEILYSSKGSYVIEDFSISYLTALRDLLNFDSVPTNSEEAIVIGDPDFDYSSQHDSIEQDNQHQLPIQYSLKRSLADCLELKFEPLKFSKKECELLSLRFEEHESIYSSEYYNERAGEEILKNIETPPFLAHISTHGFFCNNSGLQGFTNPLLNSGLVFRGANNKEQFNLHSTSEDGILTALEVLGLNLFGTELVTLSACETGVGDIINGEGVFGLRRAFQITGVRSLLMSMWKIPDKETGELMVNFYENWLNGESKQNALRNSSLKMLQYSRERYGHGHPYLWAGFILSGNPN